MLQIISSDKENVIAARITKKVSKNDVEKIHPLIHNIVDKGMKAHFYFELVDFEGYTLKGFWEDIKVDAAHISDYGKMAFVGDKDWQKWVAKATDFFTSSEVRFFELENKDDAQEWINL
jgi:hypothetical protein